MREVEKSAKTIEEAIEAGLKELGLNKNEVEIEVLEEPSKGFFGILGAKDARVKLIQKVYSNDPKEKAVNILKGIFEHMNLDVQIDVKELDGFTKLDFTGPDLGILIGRRGDTLDALQFYINLAANKNTEKRVKFVLDVEGYRQRREETLSNLAYKMAEKARKKRRNIILEPMNPHERRVIHTALQNHKDVFTYSEGEEPYRKIVIAPKR